MMAVLEKDAYDVILDVGKDLAENEQAEEQTCHGKTVAPEPVEILLSAGFAHKQHDGSAAVERRHG